MICFLFHATKPNQPLLGVKLVNRKIRRPFKSELVDCEYYLYYLIEVIQIQEVKYIYGVKYMYLTLDKPSEKIDFHR